MQGVTGSSAREVCWKVTAQRLPLLKAVSQRSNSIVGLRRKALVTSLPSPPRLQAVTGKGAREWGKRGLALFCHCLSCPCPSPGALTLPGEVEQGSDTRKDMF